MRTVRAHLEELHGRAARLLILFSAFFLVSLYFSPDILRHVSADLGLKLVVLSPFEIMLIELKIAFVLSLVFSLPFFIYEAAAFVKPALRKTERKFLKFTPLVVVLFFLGASFGYLAVSRFGLSFLASQAADAGVLNMWSAGSTLSFILFISLAMGFVFQLPLLVFLLSRTGILTYARLRAQRRYAILIIFVLAAVITPTTDPVSMLLVALPIWLLFEASLLFLRFS